MWIVKHARNMKFFYSIQGDATIYQGSVYRRNGVEEDFNIQNKITL
jgi:hypothetical protein